MVVGRRAFMGLAGAMAAAPSLALMAQPQGRIETFGLRAMGADAGQRVRVWLPPGYDRAARRYRTIYMLDGQYAFAGDEDGTNFAADRRVARLAAARRIQPAIIVAIDSPGDPSERFRQYMPQTIYDQSATNLRAGIERELAGRPLVSAQFLRYLLNDLKPEIDRRYRTRPDRIDTAVVGASMAGVMAGAIFVEGQQAFGRAACISPNWAIYNISMVDYVQLLRLWPAYFARLGAPAGRRLWLDHGTQMMDAGMAPHQAVIARQLVSMGWRQGRNLRTRVYTGAGHAFAQTAVQMDDVLTWLLG